MNAYHAPLVTFALVVIIEQVQTRTANSVILITMLFPINVNPVLLVHIIKLTTIGRVLIRRALTLFVSLMNTSFQINAYHAPPGYINDPNDDASGNNTKCRKCAENYYVSSDKCLPCSPGTKRDAGAIIEDGNTTCVAVLCGVDEYVSSNECESCPPGTTKAGGGNAFI